MHVRLRIAAMAALAALVAGPVLAQVPPDDPSVSACLPGTGYASGCDVDQDGDVDIFDIQLTAGRWNSSGVYTSGHNHWGETWTGATGAHGLRVEHTAASGDTSGLVGVSASMAGRGVFGYATNTNGQNDGVLGISESNGGRGVRGLANATGGTTFGVYGESKSSAGAGLFGYASSYTGTTNGVGGVSASSNGRGLYGSAVATSGVTYGVYGESISTTGRGVYGVATSTSGQTYGVLGASDSSSGRGVFGVTTSTSGQAYGVLGQSSSTDGRGMYGWATAASGFTFGVYGRSDSSSGYGLYGMASASGSGTSYGIYAQSNTATGYAGYLIGYGVDAVYVENAGSGRALRAYASSDTAVWGSTDTGTAGVDGRASGSTGRGVYGRASSATGVNYGVYGRTDSPSGYAGYFLGNLHTTGTLSKSAGSFKIDHPLDPANQYLYHSFVESPDMKNIYDGVAVLDAAGAAVVTLPAMPELHIAQRMQGNTFRIAGGKPGLEVSWQVTGIRQDAYANAHRIPVEEEKPADERGLYLHPTELGQPAELGLDYQRNPPLSE